MLNPVLLSPFIDPDAYAHRRAVWAGGGSYSYAQLRRTSALITPLKASGVWFNLDRLFPLAGEDPVQSLCCLKSRQFATTVGTVGTNIIFTPGRGWKGDGVSGYINSGFNPTTATSPNYTQNSASYGAWVETAGAVGGGYIGYDGSAGHASEFIVGGSNLFTGINTATNLNTTLGIAATGDMLTTRTSSSLTTFYQNGTSPANSSAASIALTNSNIFFLAKQAVSGTPSGFCNGRIAIGLIGGGFTAGQAAAVDAALHTYTLSQGITP